MDEKAFQKIQEAAKLLGRKLCGRVPHVVGTSLRPRAKATEIGLFVDIDTDDVSEIKQILRKIPNERKGHRIYLNIGGTPEFAGATIGFGRSY